VCVAGREGERERERERGKGSVGVCVLAIGRRVRSTYLLPIGRWTSGSRLRRRDGLRRGRREQISLHRDGPRQGRCACHCYLLWLVHQARPEAANVEGEALCKCECVRVGCGPDWRGCLGPRRSASSCSPPAAT
jgi:hypothetical protein